MRKFLLVTGFASILALFNTRPTFTQDQKFTVTVTEHTFEPGQIDVPAGVKIQVLVKNTDRSPEVSGSHDLRLERLVPGIRAVFSYKVSANA